jgi:hypothetical protein
MSRPFSSGYLKYPGFGDIKLASGTAPNQDIPPFITRDTHLKGYRSDLGHCVRSMEEANIARCLMVSRLDYIYEPQAFRLNVTMGSDLFRSKSITYTPDFFVPSTGDYIEVKGTWRPRSIGTKALMKLVMFTEQYSDKKLVLIHSYDYRRDFPGFNLRTKEEILTPDMKKVFAVPIKEHPDLFWWEAGNRTSGYNVHTCPTFFGEESEIDDWERYVIISERKALVMVNRLLGEIHGHEKRLEEVESEVYELERDMKKNIDHDRHKFQSFLSQMSSLDEKIQDAKACLSSMYSVVGDYEEIPADTDLSEFDEFGDSFKAALAGIKTEIEEVKGQ